MELGGVYFDIALKLALIAFLAGAILSLLLANRITRGPRNRIAAALVGGVVLVPIAFALFFTPWFQSAHQRQNTKVPQNVPCLSYDADPGYLEASYRMNRDEFIAWVQSHPWKLAPTDHVHFVRNGQTVDSFAGLKYATPIEPDSDGGQMRAYHEGDTAWISYNAR